MMGRWTQSYPIRITMERSTQSNTIRTTMGRSTRFSGCRCQANGEIDQIQRLQMSIRCLDRPDSAGADVKFRSTEFALKPVDKFEYVLCCSRGFADFISAQFLLSLRFYSYESS